jgi:RsiW-degrading membrane proteinase PrsW (M82 family)
LVLGATLSFALSFVVQLQAIGVGIAAIAILLAPITEEIFKGLSILIVTLLVWKAIPNRRYGALLGAAAGLGFSLAENILYSAQFAASSGQLPNAAELIVSRWLGLPFMHVLWSALIGVGIFVFLSQRNASQNTPSWLPLPFLLIGFLAHTVWNIVAVALSAVLGSVLLIIVLNVILVFTPFALLFRDFLGGHFNFQNFLAPQPEPSDYLPATSPPPPPPPPPA